MLVFPALGPLAWLEFAVVSANRVPDCSQWNVSITCALIPVVDDSIARYAAYAVAGCLFLGALLVRQRAWSFTLLAGAMIAPVAELHPHYWLLIFVAFVAAAAHIARMRAERLLGERVSARPLTRLPGGSEGAAARP
jgi:hypothetical protein